MEQFSLAEYLKNPTRPIVTRDGNLVRILCTDKIGKWPIVALVYKGEEELLATYTINGQKYIPKAEVSFDDLFFASESKTKKVGWMNICKYGDSEYFTIVGNVVFPTREEALKCKSEHSVDTIQVRWEE